MVAPSGEYVLNKYRHPGFAIAYTVAKEDVRRWILDSWKTVHPSAKVTR